MSRSEALADVASPSLTASTAPPLRALLLTRDFPPVRGGIQSWMFELASRLPDADVTVLTVAATQAFDHHAGVHVVRLRSSRFGQLPWLVHLALATCITSVIRRPDLIVCGHVVTAPAALLPGWLLRIPFVTFAYAWEIRRRRWRRFLSFLLSRAALVLASSRFTQRELLAHHVPTERIRVLHPGVAPERFVPRPGDSARRSAGKTILTVSRLNERYKGHDMVIRALPLVRAKCGDVQYVVAGDGCLRNYLTTLANSVGVRESVQFAGEVSDAVLADLIRSCDVMVQMSRESVTGGGAEGFGIVCLEAAAARKPVVAGRSGGLTDAIVDGVTGLLVDPQDLGTIAEAIAAVLSDPALADRLGRQAQVRVTQEFTWDHMARRARHLFAEVAGKPWQETCTSSA